MDTALLFLLLSETVMYLLWIQFTKKENSFYFGIVGGLPDRGAYTDSGDQLCGFGGIVC